MKKALIIKSTGNIYKIKVEQTNEILEARLLGKFRIKDIKTTSPLVVGDYVYFNYDKDNKVVIEYILPRKNYIVRKSVNLSKQNHIIASNIDQCFLICTIIDPDISLGFIDRFLAVAQAFRIDVILVFNKIDILQTKEQKEYLKTIKNIYKNIGYNTLEVSCNENIGIDDLKKLLLNKKTLISGNSGVGKSSMINLICPELNLKTKEISDYHKKGQHTTTFSELFELDFGGYIIDSPGIKSFGIIDDLKKEDIKDYFTEFFNKSKECKYNNCTHTKEPYCAVIKSIQDNEISTTRYDSYLSILDEIEQRN